MKPISLKMQAFGPYVEQITIHFDEFDQSGLYLIAGDTGSGKTTIFDAILFALYGETSGKRKQANMLRSLYADAELETFVEFTFQFQGSTYTIKRRPQYVVSKKTKDGEIKEVKKMQDAEFIYPDGRSIHQPTKVTQEVESLLGLNHDQFSMLAMIPQGKFETFLLSETKKKNEIFRELFHTEIYKRIQEVLKEDSKELSNQLQMERTEMNAYLDQFQFEEGTDNPLEALNPEQQEDIIKCLNDVIKKDKTSSKGIKKTLDEYNKNLEQYIQNLTKLEAYQRQTKEKEDLRNDLQQKEKAFKKVKTEWNRIDHKKYSKELEEQKILLHEYQQELPKYKALKELQEQLENQKESIDSLMDDIKQKKKEVKEVTEKKDKLNQTIKPYKNVDSEINRASILQNELELQQKQINEAQKKLNSRIQLDKDINRLQNELKKALTNSGKENELYQTLLHTFLAGQAGLLAEKLIENEPCPVCGSIHHPNKAKIQKGLPTQEEVKKQEGIAKKASEQAKQLSGQIEQAQKQSKSSLKEEDAYFKALKVTVDTDVDKCKALQNRFNDIQKQLDNVEQNLKQLHQNKQTLEKANKDYEECEDKIKNNTEQLKESEKNLAVAKERLTNLEKQIKQNKKNLTSKDEDTLNAKIEKLSKQIEQKEESYKDLKERVDKYQSQIKEENARIQQIEKDLPKDLNLSKIQKEYDEISKQKQTLSDKRDSLSNQHTNLQSRVQNNESIKDAYELKLNTYQDDLKHWQWMNELSLTADAGIKGKEKITFEDYIQMVYFDRILVRANQRLLKLSNGLYQMVRSDQANLQSHQALDIDVIDYANGTTRSIKTLSGGELFEASLALALGLSDEVQSQIGGIEIDTMFIDEGFGTLDRESLNHAIQVLAGLASSGKHIGIISHVEELKNKIASQVIVKKNEHHLGSEILIHTELND